MEKEQQEETESTGVEYSSFGGNTRLLARQFEESVDQDYYTEPTTDHIPYKYDDALKYRFPEQKKYVAAHNYIPAASVVDPGKNRWQNNETRAFKKFNYEQPSSFVRKQQQDYRPVASSNARLGNYEKGPYSRSRGAVRPPRNERINYTDHKPSRETTVTSGKSRSDSPEGQFMGHRLKVPLYVYDDEKQLFESIRDGTYGISTSQISDAASISNVRAESVGGLLNSGPAAMYNYHRLHPLATAPTTGEKAYFNMNPRIYDYSDNTYQPIKVDTDVVRAEAKTLESMGLSSKDIA